MSGPTIAEHARLVRLEAELLKVRRLGSEIIKYGYGGGRRRLLEVKLGGLLVVLTEMEQCGDVSGDNAHIFAQAIAAGRRAELAR